MPVTPNDFDLKKISFAKPKPCQITTKEKDDRGNITEQVINYMRLFVLYDGEKDWTFALPECFSFGVQRKVMSGRIKWSISAVLHDRDGATDEQEAFTTMLKSYVDHVTKHIVSIGEEIGTADIEARDLRGLSPIYLKKDKTGKVAADATPTLYPALNHSGDSVNTDFYDEKDDPVPIDGLIEAALAANNVYIGGKNNMNSKIQTTVEEAVIRKKSSRTNRLLGNGGVRRKWKPPADEEEKEVKIEGAGGNEEEVNETKKKPAPKKKLDDSDDEGEKEEREVKEVKKTPPKKKAPPKKAESDDEGSDEDEKPKKPTKKAPPKRKAPPKKKIEDSDDEDSD
jgi:hypothetical protein